MAPDRNVLDDLNSDNCRRACIGIDSAKKRVRDWLIAFMISYDRIRPLETRLINPTRDYLQLEEKILR